MKLTDLKLYMEKIMKNNKNRKIKENKDVSTNKNIDEIIKKLKANWSIFVSLGSGVFAIITVFVKCLIYAKEKAYFDFWKIPIKYINMKNENMIIELLLIGVSGFIVILLCNIYWFLMKTFWKNNKIGVVILGLILPLFSFFMIVIGILQNGKYTIKIVWDYFKLAPRETIREVCFLSIVLIFLIIVSNLSFKGVQKLVFSIKGIKKLNMTGVFIIGVSLVIAGAILFCNTYVNSITAYENENKLEIVTINDKQYVVIAQYEGKYIIKECKFKDKCVYVNQDEYMFKDISSYPIRIYENVISNEKCRLEYEAFKMN